MSVNTMNAFRQPAGTVIKSRMNISDMVSYYDVKQLILAVYLNRARYLQVPLSYTQCFHHYVAEECLQIISSF